MHGFFAAALRLKSPASHAPGSKPEPLINKLLPSPHLPTPTTQPPGQGGHRQAGGARGQRALPGGADGPGGGGAAGQLPAAAPGPAHPAPALAGRAALP